MCAWVRDPLKMTIVLNRSQSDLVQDLQRLLRFKNSFRQLLPHPDAGHNSAQGIRMAWNFFKANGCCSIHGLMSTTKRIASLDPFDLHKPHIWISVEATGGAPVVDPRVEYPLLRRFE